MASGVELTNYAKVDKPTELKYFASLQISRYVFPRSDQSKNKLGQFKQMADFVLFRCLLVDEAIRLEEVASLAFHACLEVDLLEDAKVDHAFLEVCVRGCTCCDA
jgi:hypothetical protein